jgi:transketolase
MTNAVGMALAEKLLAQEFNRDGHTVVDHHSYVFLGDGCLMEGISHEAAALAGAWKLNKLIALYDSNGISIDGQVAPWFVDNTALRFVAYGWNVLGPIDGHDAELVAHTIVEAKKSTERPTLIICKTAIGQGSPNRANTAKAHGEPLGAEEIKLTREALNWPHAPFVIPKPVYAAWDAKASGAAAEQGWNERFKAYQAAHPDLARELVRRMKGDLPPDALASARHQGHAAPKVQNIRHLVSSLASAGSPHPRSAFRRRGNRNFGAGQAVGQRRPISISGSITSRARIHSSGRPKRPSSAPRRLPAMAAVESESPSWLAAILRVSTRSSPRRAANRAMARAS